MNKPTENYSANINLLCKRAKNYSGYKEGEVAEDGCPMGMTVFAIMAKYLWMFQRDGLHPIELKADEIPNLEELTKVFHENYVVKPEKAKLRDAGDFLSDYVLRG